ncbi:MAG: hypothetical protein WA072_04330, partial [Candidatus Moraniibacteriota bacterium]
MDFNLYKPEKKPSIWRLQISFKFAVFVIAFLSLGVLWLLYVYNRISSVQYHYPAITHKKHVVKVVPETPVKDEWRFAPGPISMEQVKKNGCVADGFLSGYGDKTAEISRMLERSKCVYLHRALETWLRPPDFEKAVKIMKNVDKKPVVYGMFLAEAISTRRDYEDPNWDHEFEFKKMCRNGNYNQWEKNSCIPSVNEPEYRRYLKSITHRAMDIGIQSFMFGQMELQDENPTFEETEIKKVLSDMRDYAKEKNMQIIIGAQTNSIVDEKYLRLFDYIEGGVGIN